MTALTYARLGWVMQSLGVELRQLILYRHERYEQTDSDDDADRIVRPMEDRLQSR